MITFVLMLTQVLNSITSLDPFQISSSLVLKYYCVSLSDCYCLLKVLMHLVQYFHSFVDLPNLSASIYSTELCNRLRAFLISCPPSGPSSPVAELVIATSDFQRDLVNWSIG